MTDPTLSDLTQVMEGYALRSQGDPPPSVDVDHKDRQTRDLAEHHTTASILPASTVVSSMSDTLSEEIHADRTE